ncbi:MAG TPA: sulfatase, partial [Ruminiclostridium sp.]|nr:sulfatase [Ruminiclostridium sp.]
LLVVALSFAISIVGVQISSVFSLVIVWRFIKSPILFILNTLPITLFMLFIFFITSRIWASFFFGGAPFLILHFINRFKIRLRHEPFVPADIYLGNESTKVINLSQLPFNAKLYGLIAVFILFSLFLLLCVKSKPMKLLQRGIGILLTVVLSFTLYNTIYSNTSLYNKFKIYGSQYSQIDVVNSRGFIYSFLIKTHTFDLPVPEGYSPSECENILSKYNNIKEDENVKLPHIIAVMSEAFWDIDKVEQIEFNKGYDPLENFNKITSQSYYGKIVTTIFAGGTSDSEFSFLTGHSKTTLSDFANPYINLIRKDTYALPWILKSKGYKTTGFHPGFPWFYNRYNVYDYFGFDNIFFIDDMDIDRENTYYVSDMDAFKFLLDDFSSHLNNHPDTPYFNFTVTIQNHGPYANYDLGNPEIIKKESIDSEYYHLVNNYTNGLMSCDKALGYLVGQLEKINEPVVLLYFSDHLPLLGENFSGYKAMNYNIGTSGDLEAYLNTYETPYFIWSNSPAKDLLKDQGKTPFVGEAPYISVHYLVLELFDYIGLNDIDYFQYLRELREEFQVMTNRFYKTKDGAYTEDLNLEQMEKINEYKLLQYYMLFDKNVESFR